MNVCRLARRLCVFENKKADVELSMNN
ncbi:Hypothetical protein, putative [Bodo saltans]|uniref:Uncharacterized protein n=1 Tax=Bodo saltans TaxID=75058 RepID=A0A0S4IUA6_BODSA|nr:Hypothetical protein, putative [Bodo saltans]|eukprot:CUF24998.1 Hypothetical protein, putative [Bodo saltans]